MRVPVELSCSILQVSRAAYYRWLQGRPSRRTAENTDIADKTVQLHSDHPDMGYRRLRDQLQWKYKIDISDKRMRRIPESCRSSPPLSTIAKAVPKVRKIPSSLQRTYWTAGSMRRSQMRSGSQM